MPPIHALLCDLDNTLAQDSRSIRLSFARVFPLLSARYPNLDEETVYQVYRRINNWHWSHFDESAISRYDDPLNPRIIIWSEFLHEIGCPDGENARTFAEIFSQARDETYECYEDTIPVLRQLMGRLPIILLTNGHSKIQRKKIELCGLEPYFDAIVIAQEAGVSKPDPAIFRKALSIANVAAENALILGDNIEKDIEGGKGAGLQTAWLRRKEKAWDDEDPKPDYTISVMDEVVEIIERSTA